MSKKHIKFLAYPLSFLTLTVMVISSFSAVLGEVNAESKTSKITSSKYDFNGDKKNDNLAVQFTKDYDYTGYKLTVGSKSITVKNDYFYSAKVEQLDINKKDKFKEVVISVSSDNDYQYMYIYRYDGKNLRQIGKLPGGRVHNSGNVSFVGDGTIKTYDRLDILGTFNYQPRYKIDEKKQSLVMIKEKSYLVLDKQQATVIKPFKAYSSITSKTPTITLQKGDKITRIGTDAKQWIQCKTQKGKVVWIKAAAEDPKSEWLFYCLIDGYGDMNEYLEGFGFYG